MEAWSEYEVTLKVRVKAPSEEEARGMVWTAMQDEENVTVVDAHRKETR